MFLKFFLFGSVVLSILMPSVVIAVSEIQHWTTDKGARVYFIPAHELPIVDIQIVFDAGSARDKSYPGLSQLTNALLDSGTKGLSADVVADQLDGVGALLDTGALRDMAWISLRSLSDSRYLQLATDLVAQLLSKPAFSTHALEQKRNLMIAQVRSLAQSPAAIGQQTFYKVLYGDHPYASPPEGTEIGLKAITQEKVKDFYERYYVATNATIAIVGDLDLAAAKNLSMKLIGNLPKGNSAPPLQRVVPLNEAKLVQIPYPSSQSHIYMGQVGIHRGDEDYFSLYLGNHILGGDGLISKLGQEVREKHGLSYSVYSYFTPMQRRGPFLIGLQTRNDQTDQAVKLLQSTLQDFVTEGPSKAAFKAAQKNITGGFALRIDSNRKLVQYLSMIGFYNMPLDHLKTFTVKINALSLEEVSDAFQRRIQPSKFITVIVGGA